MTRLLVTPSESRIGIPLDWRQLLPGHIQASPTGTPLQTAFCDHRSSAAVFFLSNPLITTKDSHRQTKASSALPIFKVVTYTSSTS